MLAGYPGRSFNLAAGVWTEDQAYPAVPLERRDFATVHYAAAHIFKFETKASDVLSP